MAEKIPPAAQPPGFDVEAELRRLARSIIAQRHRDIPADLLDDVIANDDGIRAEYEALIDQMRVRKSPDFPRSGIIPNQGIRVFEVAEDPDGKVAYGGRRYTVTANYVMHYVPNRPRRTIAPWALSYGQHRSS